MDDESFIVEMYEFVLRNWCFKNISPLEIVSFANGDKAVLELSRENPDLFITDQSHPGMKCRFESDHRHQSCRRMNGRFISWRPHRERSCGAADKTLSPSARPP